MKSNKVLLIFNIIIFVILIVCLIFNAFIVASIVDVKNQLAEDPEAGEALGGGIGLAILLVFQMILAIPYAICSIVAIVSMCKKYFNWLSIANTCMCAVGIILVVAMLVIV